MPTPPGIPEIVKIGRSYVDLKWAKPKSDGGSKITGYIVERRDKGGYVWIKAHDLMVQDTSLTVLNLIEGSEYEFRVYAVNSAGKSDPSLNTMPVKVRDAADGVKPDILKKFGNITTAIGKPVTLTVEAAGRAPIKVQIINWKNIGKFTRKKTKFPKKYFHQSINQSIRD